MERYTLLPLDTVTVANWADVGDLFYGELNEDGERPILRPGTKAVVMLITDHGFEYTLDAEFGEDFDAAAAMVEAIYTKGSVNLAKWVCRPEPIYGSEAYIRGDYEGQRADREREDARFESAGRWA